ncbi:MAG: antibiotic biosynthesis monooxygenase [Anaerolineae bacterium]|nr:antibiotic biosynthesis monooxygenase [Anaerolineae bacterium]
MYACYVKFRAQPGQRDALVEHLLNAAHSVEPLADCHLYLVNTSPTEADAVWVTEIWHSEAAHDAFLTDEATRAAIQQVLPLLADRPEKINLVAVGGKGIAAE